MNSRQWFIPGFNLWGRWGTHHNSLRVHESLLFDLTSAGHAISVNNHQFYSLPPEWLCGC